MQYKPKINGPEDRRADRVPWPKTRRRLLFKKQCALCSLTWLLGNDTDFFDSVMLKTQSQIITGWNATFSLCVYPTLQLDFLLMCWWECPNWNYARFFTSCMCAYIESIVFLKIAPVIAPLCIMCWLYKADSKTDEPSKPAWITL